MSSPSQTQFFETREYQRFREFCNACGQFRYIGLCYGPPGVGKTLSARHYAHWDLVESIKPFSGHRLPRSELSQCHSIFYTVKVVTTPKEIDREIAGLRNRLYGLWKQAVSEEKEPRISKALQTEREERHNVLWKHDWLSGRPYRPLQRAEKEVTEAFKEYNDECMRLEDPSELIIIDEADRLKMAALEQVRYIFDRSNIGVVLIGMPGLEKRLARYPQLYSRVGFVHEFRPLKQEEVRELLQKRWRPENVSLPENILEDEEGIAAITRVTGGNFRLLHRLLTQISRILEINELDVVTREVVDAARESLVIGAG